MKSRYTLIWRECGLGSSTAARFQVAGFEGHLPFFLEGDAVAALESAEGVELREEHLLKGILYGLSEIDPGGRPRCSTHSRSTLMYLLDVLIANFEFPDPERMILDTAASVREVCGSTPSSVILSNGLGLIPRSSKIRADLLIDLWMVSASMEEEGERREQLGKIVELVQSIDMSEVLSKAREGIAYYGLASLVLLGRFEALDAYLPKYVYPHVSDATLKEKIRQLLEAPDAARQTELTIR